MELRFPKLPAAEVSILTCTFTLSGYKCLVVALKSLPIRHKIQIIFLVLLDHKAHSDQFENRDLLKPVLDAVDSVLTVHCNEQINLY